MYNLLGTLFFRDKITAAIISMVGASHEFAAYSNSENDDARKLLDNFARHLFAWRRPYPKFRQVDARAWRILKINKWQFYVHCLRSC